MGVGAVGGAQRAHGHVATHSRFAHHPCVGARRQRVPCAHGPLATPTNPHPRVDDRGVGLQLAAHEMGHCRLPRADVSRHEHWHWLAGAGPGAVALAHPVSGGPLGVARAAAPVHPQYVSLVWPDDAGPAPFKQWPRRHR